MQCSILGTFLYNGWLAKLGQAVCRQWVKVLQSRIELETFGCEAARLNAPPTRR